MFRMGFALLLKVSLPEKLRSPCRKTIVRFFDTDFFAFQVSMQCTFFNLRDPHTPHDCAGTVGSNSNCNLIHLPGTVDIQGGIPCLVFSDRHG